MNPLFGIKTHYSIREAYGSPVDYARYARENGYGMVGIADSDSCMGHREFESACKEFAIKPVFGMKTDYGQVYAPNENGLFELYDMASKRKLNTHGTVAVFNPDYILRAKDEPEGDISFISLSLEHSKFGVEQCLQQDFVPIICQTPLYPDAAMRSSYEIVARRKSWYSLFPRHIVRLTDYCDLLAAKFGSEIVERAKEETANFAQLFESVNLPRSVPRLEVKGSEHLPNLCWDSLRARFKDDTVYAERLRYELEVIESKRLGWYFALVSTIIEHVKSQGEITGPGRGSCCGSLVCYLLGITGVNPIEHGLLFERFIDISRPDLPDIDIDFTPRGRQLAIGYMQRHYGGADQISQLITVSRYQYSSLVNDLKRDYGQDTFLPQGMFAASGTPRHYSKHPSAIAISSRPLREIAPVNQKGLLMLESGLARQTAELDAGLVKIDALGLSQISIFNQFCEATGTSLDDYYLIHPHIIERFNSREYSGIFQFGFAVKSIASEIAFDSFSDIVDIIALARPGPRDAGYTDRWISAKASGHDAIARNPDIDAILRPTKGVFIYQEQVMEICRKVAGFSWPDVNAVRRGIGKKKVELIQKYKPQFIEKCMAKYGSGSANWEQLWDAIEGCGNYAFNKSHATAYALIAYACMAMKTAHPGEYYAAYLTHESDGELVMEAIKEWGKGFRPFDPVKSHAVNWTYDGESFIAPLTNVIGVGERTAIVAAQIRDKDGSLPSKFNGKLKYRISSLCPIHDQFIREHGSYEAAGIATDPMPVKEFCRANSAKDAVLLGRVDMKSTKPYKYADTKGKTAQYLSFRLTDDTGNVFARFHPYLQSDLDRASEEINGGKIVALKGNLYRRDAFSMMFVDRYKVL